MNKSIEYIVSWLRDYNEQAHTDGFVVGLSGGIDSALVAALCEKACPGQVLGVLMPCHSNPQDAIDAHAVAEALSIATLTIPLDDPFDSLFEVLKANSEGEIKRMSKANIKPRLRMISLYFYANLMNRLVVGTGNRDERYVGYFTKWGDGAADLMPIAHLSKDEVWAMARELGVPEQVITKAPSAGLWEAQTDEQEMGFTYRVLDQYIRGQAVPEEAKQRIERLHRASGHKLVVPPYIKEND